MFLSSPGELLPPTDTLAEAHRLALARLRVMGMEIAGKLHAQSQEPEADLGDIATKFARVARAVRQTIALESKLAEEDRFRAHEAKALEVSRRKPDPPAWVQNLGVGRAEFDRRRAENKLEAVLLVGRAAGKAQGFDRETLHERLYERLEDDPTDRRFEADSDIGEAINGLCRDLGLDPDWAALTDPDWGQISRETRSVLTGQPLETLPPARWQREDFYTIPPRTLPTYNKTRDFLAPDG